MKKGGMIGIGVSIFFACTLIGCSYMEQNMKIEKSPDYVFTYAENQAEEYPSTKAAYLFSDLVFEQSEGRIKINVYAGGVLGDEISIIDQLQYGGVDFARVSIMTMGEFVPKMNILQLPYLYEDMEHKWNVLNGEIGQEFMDCLVEYDLISLSWYDAGTRNFYTSQKIVTLEDLRGKRLRVAKSAFMEMVVSSLGAIPVRMDYSDIYSALEQGKIDGAENNWPSYEATEHYKVARYMLENGHNQIPELQLASRVTWNKLSEEDKILIRECAMVSSEYEQELWKAYEKESRDRAEAAGVETVELSDEELARFREAVQPVYEEFGAEYVELIERIIEVGKNTIGE
jgi:tripartite ATP-independent periplasmic transporter solute receptor, DctP family